jgi:hypothetical protein
LRSLVQRFFTSEVGVVIATGKKMSASGEAVCICGGSGCGVGGGCSSGSKNLLRAVCDPRTE